MLEAKFTRQDRNQLKIPTIRLLIFTGAFLFGGISSLGHPDGGSKGIFFLILGTGLVVGYLLYLRWRFSHPVQLVFDEDGFGGHRVLIRLASNNDASGCLVRTGPKKRRVPWNQVATAKLEEHLSSENDIEGSEIEITLITGAKFKIDVHHLNHVPIVVFSEFKSFMEGRGHRLATGGAPAPVPTKSRRFRVTTNNGAVHEVEGNTLDEATAFAVLANLTVVSVDELPQQANGE